MVFVACGLNHKTAPIGIREKLSPTTQKQESLLLQLALQPSVNEAVILATCNRTEIYCETEDTAFLIPWLAQQHDMPIQTLLPYMYQHHADAGIRHAMRVACGLDSMMLGEPQIFGQMKQAYQRAQNIGTIGKQLHYLFQRIFNTSKKIRSDTEIGVNPVSIAYAGLNLTQRIFSDFSRLTVLLVGSGETASLVSKYLKESGVEHFFVASRSLDNARQLANSLDGVSLTIGEIADYLPKADIVISATACPLPFIGKTLVERATRKRQHRPMFFLDLSVPRDIEPDVSEVPDVFLYNIDDLQNLVVEGLHGRKNAARKAEQIIESELNEYIRSYRSLKATEHICQYRDKMEALGFAEVQKTLKQIGRGMPTEQAVTLLGKRLVNKLMHQPSTGLRRAAYEGREDMLELANYLFTNTDESTN